MRIAHKPITIGVAGSVGKTSTKAAVASVLSQKYKVAWQKGNYNDIISIPLVFFGESMPPLYNPFAWVRVLIANEVKISKSYPYEVVVLELGTDHAGDMAQLEGVLKIDYTLLTAITPEHMEGFEDLDDVAEDELIAAHLARQVIVDTDSVAKAYVDQIITPLTISTKEGDCVIKASKLMSGGRNVIFQLGGAAYDIKSKLIGAQNLPSLAFALIIGKRLKLTDEQLRVGLESIEPFPGRMNLLIGKNDSRLIDDTYSSSPHALHAALKTLYEMDGKQKIAILGRMNEMGHFSEGYHREAGKLCDPKHIDLLVTLGDDTNKYLAPEAEKNGCKVVRCSSPYQAADVVLPLLTNDTVVLLKGSQNKGFLEEATAALLKDSEDSNKLVRQSPYWLKIKEREFTQ